MHWKTTLGGILFALAKGLEQNPNPMYTLAGQALEVLAVGWLGYHAADKRKP